MVSDTQLRVKKVVNNPASISAVTSPKKFGYDFTGYFTSANGEGNKFADGINPLMQTPNANHTVAITKDTVMFNAKKTHILYMRIIHRVHRSSVLTSRAV